MTDQPLSDAALARFLSGECDSAEAAAIRRWIEADPERRRRVEALRAAWQEAERDEREWDTDALWAGIEARMDRPAEPPRPRPVAAPRVREWPLRRRSHWGAIAASLLVAAGGALWLTTRDPQRAEAPVPMREVVTRKGQRAELHLGDGTRVILGVDSRLRFPAVTGTRARDVELDGEAFFEVTHDPDHPFRVRAGGTIAEDLGTEFIVKAYPGDTAVRVVVAEGEVAVRREGAPDAEAVTLVPGELASVGSAGAPVVERNIDLDMYFAWTTGRLQFRRTPLGTVIRELERWYDVEITLADSALAAIPLTGSFKDQSATDVLDAVARSLDLRYERLGDTYRFRP